MAIPMSDANPMARMAAQRQIKTMGMVSNPMFVIYSGARIGNERVRRELYERRV